MKKFEEIKNTLVEKFSDLEDEHPYIWTGLVTGAGLVACVPLLIGCYKFYGQIEGKAIAKELAKAGVQLGYNHD